MRYPTLLCCDKSAAAKLRELQKGKIRSEKRHGERLLQPVVPAPGQRNVTVIALKELPWQRLTFGKFGRIASFLERETGCRLGDLRHLDFCL